MQPASVVKGRARAYRQIRAVLSEHGYLVADLHKITRISSSACDARLAGRSGWRSGEMYLFMKFFSLPHEELSKYFPEDIYE